MHIHVRIYVPLVVADGLEYWTNLTEATAQAGKTRHLGWTPHVRGSAKNAADHAHGGGEGRPGVGQRSEVPGLGGSDCCAATKEFAEWMSSLRLVDI